MSVRLSSLYMLSKMGIKYASVLPDPDSEWSSIFLPSKIPASTVILWMSVRDVTLACASDADTRDELRSLKGCFKKFALLIYLIIKNYISYAIPFPFTLCNFSKSYLIFRFHI